MSLIFWIKNNSCELSHQPSRQQERRMRRFISQGQAQRFLSCHGVVNSLFRLDRHLMKAKNYRMRRERAFNEWTRVSCVMNLVKVTEDQFLSRIFDKLTMPFSGIEPHTATANSI
jgi:hypothetical protein